MTWKTMVLDVVLDKLREHHRVSLGELQEALNDERIYMARTLLNDTLVGYQKACGLETDGDSVWWISRPASANPHGIPEFS